MEDFFISKASKDLKKWFNHIEKTSKKANAMGFVHRNLCHCPLECRKTYTDLGCSTLELEYGSVRVDQSPPEV